MDNNQRSSGKKVFAWQPKHDVAMITSVGLLLKFSSMLNTCYVHNEQTEVLRPAKSRWYKLMNLIVY